MENLVYVKLKAPICNHDKLRVNVGYELGGHNWFTGGINERGIYVYLTPCTCENGIVGYSVNGNQHESGYKILLKELKRNNKKQIALASELILPYAQQIADYYSDGRHNAVYNMIMKLYKSDK